MKRIIPFLITALIFISCASGRVDNNIPARADGLPVWVGNTFTNPKGYWKGYITEKGLYTWGEAKYPDSKIALNAAELDAKERLAKQITDTNPILLSRVQRVDFFKSEDGTVYVLVFISNKDLKAVTKK